MLENIKQAKNWEDRYRFIIQAGKHLPQPSPDELAQMQSIQGCESGLWFMPIPQHDDTFQFQAYSEARIMNGLLWLLLQNINGQTRNQLQQFNIRQFFDELGVASRLSETRLNGLKQIEEILHNL
ncbi:SufE family protein [uncultured Haemophilus sp.]|jgi:sulfur transfer protein SufE|uniref:SufE family protein n=1 Tax=uncultured Haemophilus sp. TaxID=237779 RepID=UPI001D235259|nr:SufE family protein [uncultured Haemophilus sp.]MBS5163289.1 SufE family protein [Haemophilus parainfluenzae]